MLIQRSSVNSSNLLQLEKLKEKFPPKYPEFVGHHITLKFGVPKNTQTPAEPDSVEVVGYADSGDGLEALVVEVNGNRKRADGRVYHITWSLDRSAGYKPVDSNNLVSNKYSMIRPPIKISTTPKVLK